MPMMRGAARGQTIPLYLFGVIISMVLTLFLVNYSNTVRWHERAQNAADAAALAALAGEAGLMNQRTIAEYNAALDEYRLQAILFGMVNAANGFGTSAVQSTTGSPTSTCDPSPAHDDTGTDCDNAYDVKPYYYSEALLQYVRAVQALQALQNPAAPANATPVPAATGASTPPPAPSSPPGSSAGAAFSLVQSERYCWDKSALQPGVFDCSFYYNADLSHTGPGSSEVVDVVTCRTVTAKFAALFAGLLPASFNAAGRSAATLLPVQETFSPGTEINLNTPGIAYQPVEKCPPANGPSGGPCSNADGWIDSPAYNVDFSPFTVTLTFYVPALTTPLTTPNWTRSCEPG
jgi:Flp pilus assembly protein TadG